MFIYSVVDFIFFYLFTTKIRVQLEKSNRKYRSSLFLDLLTNHFFKFLFICNFVCSSKLKRFSMFPDNPIFIPRKLIMQEYRPFDRIEVYREIVETIKKRHILPTETYIPAPVVKNRIRKKKKSS